MEPEEQIKSIEYSELLKQVAQLREQIARSRLHIEKLEKQLAEKEEQIIRFRADSFVLDGEGLLKDQGHGADVILATSNSHKAIVDSVKGLRPDGRLIDC